MWKERGVRGQGREVHMYSLFILVSSLKHFFNGNEIKTYKKVLRVFIRSCNQILLTHFHFLFSVQPYVWFMKLPNCHTGMYYFVQLWLYFLMHAACSCPLPLSDTIAICWDARQVSSAITCVFTFIQTKTHHRSPHTSFKCHLINAHLVSINT